MTALWTLAAGALLVLAGWRWSARGLGGASHVALIAVLGTAAAAFNVVVPVPSIEVTTTVVLVSAIVLGAPTGIAVALVVVVGSSLGGGVGAWTIWQVVAGGAIAVIGEGIGWASGRDADWSSSRRVAVLGVLAGMGAVAWDVIVTMGSLASYAPSSGSMLQHMVGALLLGAAFTLVHAAMTIIITVLGGPPLAFALQRARPRLDGGVVAQSPELVR